MGKAQLEELSRNGRYFSVPSGVSMRPMLDNKTGIVEIHKLEGLAKRYDVVMYTRPDSVGVIHRVLHVRSNDYVIAGDNCWRREYVPHDQVHGIAVRFYRKGHWYDMEKSRGYRIYSHLCADLFFVRAPLFYIRDRFAGLIRRA